MGTTQVMIQRDLLMGLAFPLKKVLEQHKSHFGRDPRICLEYAAFVPGKATPGFEDIWVPILIQETPEKRSVLEMKQWTVDASMRMLADKTPTIDDSIANKDTVYTQCNYVSLSSPYYLAAAAVETPILKSEYDWNRRALQSGGKTAKQAWRPSKLVHRIVANLADSLSL